ncbi:MAG: FG-GAP repeat protein [Solirubrobacterales bacterium]
MVYVFVAPSGPNTWINDDTASATLVASEGAEGDFLGFSVAISGPTIVAGAMQDDVGLNNVQGSAYVFERPGAGWPDSSGIESTKLLASDGGAFDRLGFSTAIHGDAIVLGSSGHDVDGKQDQGAAYLYVKPVAGWQSAVPRTESQELLASDGRAGDRFGISVAVSANAAAAGASDDKIDGNLSQGSAYVFDSR